MWNVECAENKWININHLSKAHHHKFSVLEVRTNCIRHTKKYHKVYKPCRSYLVVRFFLEKFIKIWHFWQLRLQSFFRAYKNLITVLLRDYEQLLIKLCFFLWTFRRIVTFFLLYSKRKKLSVYSFDVHIPIINKLSLFLHIIGTQSFQ